MSNSRDDDALVGQILDDRYEIVRRLAGGGMATVYVATDLRLSRTVAVKVMRESVSTDQDFVARFDAEARAAAHLSHPNVVSVFDQGHDIGRPYIVMEYIEGYTLRNLITREAPMDPLRALDIIEPVVGALSAAHAAGLIHRDVKPENVLISNRGQIKVADFGLARAVTAATHSGSAGVVIGTVSYIAPELVQHSRADTRSDVYSTGVMLYEMLTGVKPHCGESPIQVAYSHVHNDIGPPSAELTSSWRTSRTGIPPYLDALVQTAMARDREARPMDAGVLLEHLRLAREALRKGVSDDPVLTQRMRKTTVDDEAHVTHEVPALTGVIAPQRPVRFTPSTPLSPTFEVHADGLPYYSDGGPGPYSPHSPDTHVLPTLPLEPKKTRNSRARIVGVLLALVLLAGVAWGGWWLLEGRYTATPALTSLNQAQASVAAEEAGLQITFEREYSENVPVGQVVRSSPSEGERVEREGTVTVWLSRGPERYPVPTLVGQTAEKATQLLSDGYLAVGAVTEEFHDTVKAGVVVSQSVKAESSVKKGTTVNIVVSKGPAPVELADWKDKQFSKAKDALETDGLKVKSTEENHDTIGKGKVISQDPGPGQVLRGDTVSFVVSKGPELVEVPQVRGLGRTKAIEKLKDAGFKVNLNTMVSGGFGLVWGTDPKGGSMAPKGATITLHLV